MTDISCEQATEILTSIRTEFVTYSLGAQCGAEFCGVALLTLFGSSILANELLPRTKGQGMGWGAIALGWGFAYAVPIWSFSYISARLNPAVLIAEWVIGEIGVGTFFALAGCEFAGAFIGAVLVWLMYLPHFKSVPEPPPVDRDSNLLRTRDYLPETGQRYVGNKAWQKDLNPHVGLMDETLYYLRRGEESYTMPHNKLIEKVLGKRETEDPNLVAEPPEQQQADEADQYEADDERGGGEGGEEADVEAAAASGPGAPFRRRSVQVADLHKRLQALDDDVSLRRLQQDLGNGHASEEAPERQAPEHGRKQQQQQQEAQWQQWRQEREDSAPPSAVPEDARQFSYDNDGRAPPLGGRDPPLWGDGDGGEGEGEGALPPEDMRESSAAGAADDAKPRPSRRKALKASLKGAIKEMRRKMGQDSCKTLDAEYEAALLADQHAKLSVFATRPNVPSPLWNLLSEFMGTVALVFCFKMMGLRGEGIYPASNGLWATEEAFIIGWLVFLLILSLGGHTGFAANPARDLSPRVVHWLLPIPNKGPSEWRYAAVPFVGDLLGGLAAGGLFAAVKNLYHSQVAMDAMLGLDPVGA